MYWFWFFENDTTLGRSAPVLDLTEQLKPLLSDPILVANIELDKKSKNSITKSKSIKLKLNPWRKNLFMIDNILKLDLK